MLLQLKVLYFKAFLHTFTRSTNNCGECCSNKQNVLFNCTLISFTVVKQISFLFYTQAGIYKDLYSEYTIFYSAVCPSWNSSK